MWRLTELKIRNIVSFHEATLKIQQGVATLIFGKTRIMLPSLIMAPANLR